MTPPEAARLLLMSGTASVLFASLIGAAMLIPRQAWAEGWLLGVKWRHVGSAHLDWIMLGLMQAMVGVLFLVTTSPVPAWTLSVLIAGAWLNPLPYIARAFGIDAFKFAGDWVQKLFAGLGAGSSMLIIIGLTEALFLAGDAR